MEPNANPQDLQTQIDLQSSQANHLQNAESRPGSSGSPGSWVDPPGRPGFARLLHRPVF